MRMNPSLPLVYRYLSQRQGRGQNWLNLLSDSNRTHRPSGEKARRAMPSACAVTTSLSGSVAIAGVSTK